MFFLEWGSLQRNSLDLLQGEIRWQTAGQGRHFQSSHHILPYRGKFLFCRRATLSGNTRAETWYLHLSRSHSVMSRQFSLTSGQKPSRISWKNRHKDENLYLDLVEYDASL